MVTRSLKDGNNGRKRIPIREWQKFTGMDKGQVAGRKEDVGLDASEEDKAEDE